ncbi:MAG: GNAT family N-acetyltransferase [Acidimicrobiia bacterium]|nr:GNAT family N-acetyltransferase [Acidimicrobiia bacterium]MCL4291628.1 GNAT family N-acetyltransferase [Acidimicrobiia bacterium]
MSIAEPRLIGPRVSLRPLQVSDHPGWSAVRRRGRDWLEPWEPLPDPGTADPAVDVDAFRSRCGAWDRQRHFDTAYGFGMFLGDEFVGEVSLASVLRGPYQSASIGYWIDEGHAGRGLVPEGVVLVLRYGFEELYLHRIEAAIVPRNARSRRVAEKLGLRDEGTATRLLQIRGEWEDHVRYAITAEEWQARKAELEGRFLHPQPVPPASR